METIKIKKEDCEIHVFEIVPDLVNQLVLQLTECIWQYFEDVETKTIEFDLSEFGLGNLKIKKIDKGYTSYKNNIINFKEKGGLAHELNHFIFEKKGDSAHELIKDTEELITYMLKYKVNNDINKLISVELAQNGTPSDKLIVFLYYANNDELISKFTGFYVGSNYGKSKKEGGSSDDHYNLYNEMIHFHIGADMIDNENKQRVESTTKSNSLESGEFESLLNDVIKYINEKGKVFTEAYEKFIILKNIN